MKALTVVLTSLVVLASCTDIGEPVRGPLVTELRLFDRNGDEASVFRSGEEFDMRLIVTNHTGALQSFTWSPPRFVFQVKIGDSLVSSSIDGMSFIATVERGVLSDRQSDSGVWRAPNSVARPGTVVLAPGRYQARASFGGQFDEFGMLPPRTMSFTVVP